ncbi:E3 ubiquitin-protein ligase RNF135 [Pelobates fuscus]|uniref:E3 ubiquitin-protein ligase RNF135 n=1 Tax=Pelobates fuscus TaxID=191477 RepID=UPI002FE436CB
MAGREYLLLRLQPSDLTCVICHDYYKHPTTLQCGHTFCKVCLEKFWNNKNSFKCSVCQAVFREKPDFKKNTCLASILDSLEAQNSTSHHDCTSCTGPGAVNLCLPCMTPLCRDHVLLHSEDTPQQRHLLVNLLTDDSTWLCRHHEQGLKYFCLTHGSPLCPNCKEQHEACKPALLLQLYIENKDKIQKMIGELSKDITCREKDVTILKNTYQEIQILVCDIKDNLTRDFREMRDYIEKQERASFWRIKQEQEAAQRKMLEGITPTNAEIDRLKEIKAGLENTINNDWIQVLMGGPNGLWDAAKDTTIYNPSPVITSGSMFNENKIVDTTSAISQIKESLMAHPLLEQIPCPPKQVFEDTVDIESVPSTSASTAAVSQTVRSTEINQNPFLKWACNISFDPQTLNKRLSLSPDFKTVTVSNKTFLYPNNPRRFSPCQVLCSEGFSTKCWYWEINTESSNGWAIGLACGEICNNDQLGQNDLSCCVEWRKERLSAWHRKEDITIHLPKPGIVGTFLNCEEKTVSFYSITDGSQDLLHSYKIHFKTVVFPAVWLYGLKEGNSLTINNITRV